MIRVLRSQRGLPALRIWCDGDWPTDDVPVSGIAVEWAGQVGHPTSYMLLGGSPARRFDVTAQADGPLFENALEGVADIVQFGLPAEYRRAIDQVVGNAPDDAPRCTISLAAYGDAGSSIVAFRAGTIFLTTILDRATSLTDDELWTLWHASRHSADAFSANQSEDGES